jgi:peptide chain release factor 3
MCPFDGGAQQRVLLRFDDVCYRLESEYGADARLETARWTTLRWIEEGELRPGELLSSSRLAKDSLGRRVILFESDWSCRLFGGNSSSIRLTTSPTAVPDEGRSRRTRGNSAGPLRT